MCGTCVNCEYEYRDRSESIEDQFYDTLYQLRLAKNIIHIVFKTNDSILIESFIITIIFFKQK